MIRRCAFAACVCAAVAVSACMCDCVCVCMQGLSSALLFGAGTGGIGLVSLLLDECRVPIDTLAYPGVCLDCDPIVECSSCREGHGIGKETALMSACLSGQVSMVDYLLKRGASVNVANEVRVSVCEDVCEEV